MKSPGFIVFINNDLTDGVKNYMSQQLFAEFITSSFFERRVALNPLFAATSKASGKRYFVIQDNPKESNLLNHCDFIIFVKNGMAEITDTNFSNQRQMLIASLKITDLSPVT